MDDFYITLPSNVKSEYYENTVANYKTKLATNVKLDDNWKVGIASISYTKSWDLKSDVVGFEIIYYKWFTVRNYSFESFYFDMSKYKTVQEILDELNKKLSEFQVSPQNVDKIQMPKFSINKESDRVEINWAFLDNALIGIKMSPNLCRVLGFAKEQLDYFVNSTVWKYANDFNSLSLDEQFKLIDKYKLPEPKIDSLKYTANIPHSMLPTFYSLYVYCDLVRHSFVGDSFTQLMRIVEVPPESKFRDQILFSYTNIHYMNLQVKEFDSIEINIKDDLGDPIPFLFGRTIVCLHFKKL